jgi:RND superfamily putative drug exporter
VEVVLKDRVGYEESLAFVRDISAVKIPGITIRVGGHWAACRDYDALVLAAYPRIAITIMAATLVVLAVAFRSFLVPIKAIVLNTLSVTAAFGALVAVFQWGWGAAWLGLAAPAGAVPLTVPVIVFCLTFGLSMDYEVLILSRVREEFLDCGDHDVSVRRGLGATGALVSGAAAIMAIVFGAFALAGVVIVQMLGFGLAVAVIVDALVVRTLLVPATMKLAGRWNWIPGIR